MAVDFPAELRELRQTLSSILDVSDVAGLEKQVAELSERASAPDLWDDPEHAQQVTSKLSHVQAELDRLSSMSSQVEDLETLVEMAVEESDADTLAEAEVELVKVKDALGRLEVRTLLSGEYDEREALVTIRSEAGGVDAADFAEMLMRMYLRWAERHGYKTEVFDTSYAEEAGIKSATFKVAAPYAYGTLSVEQGTHRLVRISPFDNQGRRQTSFAGVEVLPQSSRRPTTSRSRRTTSGSTCTGPPARVASPSTRPTRRCGSRTSRPASSSPARTRSPSCRTRRAPCASCRPSCSNGPGRSGRPSSTR